MAVTKESLRNLGKEQLIKMILQRDAIIQYQKNVNSSKVAQIRHFRIRIKKISESLDYLLKHPFSMDNGYQVRKK